MQKAEVTFVLKTFKTQLAEVLQIAAAKHYSPTLKNVRFQASHGVVSAFATDYDLGLTVVLPDAKTTADFDVLVPVDTLKKIVKQKANTFEMLIEDQNVTITLGKINIKPVCGDAKDFPQPQDVKEVEYSLAGEVGTWADALKAVSYARSLEAPKQVLNSVFIEETEKCEINFYTTDLHRLALIEDVVLHSKGKARKEGLLLPSNAIATMEKMLKSTNEPNEAVLEIGKDDRCSFQIGATSTLTFRLVDGQFPKFRQVIPELATMPFSVAVEIKPLIAAVKQVTDFVGMSVGITFLATKTGIKLTQTSPETGEVSVDLALSEPKEFPDFMLDPLYVTEALAAIPTDVARMFVPDSLGPVVFQGSDSNAQHVVMPRRG